MPISNKFYTWGNVIGLKVNDKTFVDALEAAMIENLELLEFKDDKIVSKLENLLSRIRVMHLNRLTNIAITETDLVSWVYIYATSITQHFLNYLFTIKMLSLDEYNTGYETLLENKRTLEGDSTSNGTDFNINNVKEKDLIVNEAVYIKGKDRNVIERKEVLTDSTNRIGNVKNLLEYTRQASKALNNFINDTFVSILLPIDHIEENGLPWIMRYN